MSFRIFTVSFSDILECHFIVYSLYMVINLSFFTYLEVSHSIFCIWRSSFFSYLEVNHSIFGVWMSIILFLDIHNPIHANLILCYPKMDLQISKNQNYVIGIYKLNFETYKIGVPEVKVKAIFGYVFKSLSFR